MAIELKGTLALAGRFVVQSAGVIAPDLVVGYLNAGFVETFSALDGTLFESLDISADVPAGNWATLSPARTRMCIVDSNTTKATIVYDTSFLLPEWVLRGTTYVDPQGTISSGATFNISADSSLMVFPENNSSIRNVLTQGVDTGTSLPDLADPGINWVPSAADITIDNTVLIVGKGQGTSGTDQLRKFTAGTGAQISTGGGAGFVNLLRTNPLGTTFAEFGTSGVNIRNISNYAVAHSLNSVDRSNTRDMCFSPNGAYFALLTWTAGGGGAGLLDVYETTGWTIVQSVAFVGGDTQQPPSLTTGRRALAWSPDSTLIVCVNCVYDVPLDVFVCEIDQANVKNVNFYNPFFLAAP